MPTRSNKTSKSSAPQMTAKGKTKKGTNPKPTAGADPPIIVDGGGSVTIYSQYLFDLTSTPGATYPYVYYSKDASIGKMKMKGKGTEKDDDSDGGKFRIELYKR
jgi:hypothetical protein